MLKHVFLGALLTVSATACTPTTGVELHDAWTRQAAAGVPNAAVFMTIRSHGPDRLIAASTPVAKQTSLMTMTNAADGMGMDYVDAIDLPADTSVSLDPTGLHIWLAGLNKPLNAGDRFPVSLQFEKAGRRQVIVSVLGPTDAAPRDTHRSRD